MNQTPAKRSRRERQKDRTHRQLLEAADELFRRQGFDATTVEEIATQADVAKGTFFNYFRSKNDLPEAILASRMSNLLLSPPGAGLSTMERIELLLRTMWRELQPYRLFARRMFAHSVTRLHAAKHGAHLPTPAQAIAGLIREGQQQGTLRGDADAETVGFLITGYFFRLYMLSAGEDLSAEEIGRRLHTMMDLLFYGLLPRESSAGEAA